MGSASHGQGIPQRPGLVSSRDIRAIDQRLREKHADIRPALYVRPLGNGRHLVKNQSNDVPYKVGSLVGNTFSKDSHVLLGSNTGHPGEVILGGPPPGKKGGAEFGTVSNRRSLTFPDVVESEKVLLTGYYAFYAHGASNKSVRCSLLDITGAWVADVGLGSITFVSTFINSYNVQKFGVSNGDPPVLFVFGTTRLESGIYESAGNTLHTTSTLPAGSAIIAVDGTCYWVTAVASGSDMIATSRSATLDVTAPTTLSTATFTGSSLVDVKGMGVVDGEVLAYLATGFSGPYWILNCNTGAKTALGGALSDATRQVLPSNDGLGYGVRQMSGQPIGKVTAAGTLDIAATHWPWSTTSAGGLGKFLSQSADHEQLLVSDAGQAIVTHDFAEPPWLGSPRRTFTPANHPTLATAPFLVAVHDISI